MGDYSKSISASFKAISGNPADNAALVAYIAAHGGGAPGGSDTNIQFNNSGGFDGTANATLDASGNAYFAGTLSGPGAYGWSINSSGVASFANGNVSIGGPGSLDIETAGECNFQGQNLFGGGGGGQLQTFYGAINFGSDIDSFDSNFDYDYASGFLGLNHPSPTASLHAGIKTIYGPAGPTSDVAAINFLGGSYSFGSGNKNYTNYSFDTSTGLFSASGDTCTFTEPSSSIYDPSAANANINYAESGYTASGLTLQYQVWALYSGNAYESIGSATSTAPTDDNSGNPFGVDVNWAAPSGPTPSGYLVEMIQGPNNGQYQVISGTSFADSNSGWGSAPSLTPITYGVDLSWTTGGGDENILWNTTTNNYFTTGGGTSATDNGGWTSGTPTVTPTSFDYSSLIADGSVELMSISGKLGTFGATPVGQQNGDIIDCLLSFGLINAGLYYGNSVYYSSYGVPAFNGPALIATDANTIIDCVNKDAYFQNLVMPNGTGFDSAGNLTAIQLLLPHDSPTQADGQIYFDGLNFQFTIASTTYPFLKTPITAGQGGTGVTSFAQGALLYASANNTWSALAKNTTATRYLANTGSSNAPNWDQVNLTNGVTGTLPKGNGGLGSVGATTVVNGSTGGSVTYAMPAITDSLKIVIAKPNALTGTASYTFPSSFSGTPIIMTSNGLASSIVTSLSTTAMTITGATTTGTIILMGF